MKKFLLLLAGLLLLTGCVPVDSLNPLYTDKNVIFDPALIGKWVGSNPDDGSLRIDRAEENAYEMLFTQKNSDSVTNTVYIAHLVSLGGEKYLDVSPRQITATSQQFLFRTDPVKKNSRFEPGLERVDEGIYLEVVGPTPGKGNSQELQLRLRPAHLIFKVYLGEKTLSLAFLDEEWVRQAIRKKLLQADHLKARSENSMSWVLSGSTAELQQFVVQHADDPGAFNSGSALTKIE